MAQKITLNLEAKTDKAVQEIEDLKKQVESLQDEVQKGNKTTADGLKGVEAASGKAASGIKKIGTALKAIGIGLLLAAFAKLKEVFEENQKVADFFNTTFEALSLAFNDFFNFLDKNAGTIIDWFKGIFNDPVGAIKDFGNAIKDNLIERFNSFLDTLGFLASAVKKVFSGDFAGALEDVKSAGKESIDIITGVNNTFDRSVEIVTKAAKATAEYAKETWNSAAANVELNKQAEIAQVLQQGLIEKYDRQAEKLRQIRDEERNTLDERIAANEELKRVLDEQEAAMLEQVNTQIAAAQAQYNKNQNQENYIRLLEATQEKEAVLAQIEGFRSEQLSNDLALYRELRDLKTSIADGDFERLQAENEFLASQIGSEVARLEFQKQAAAEEAAIREKTLRDNVARTKMGTQAQIDATNELFNFLQENGNKQKELDRQIAEAKLNTISGALGGIAQLVGENSKFGKGIAVAQAIIDTYAGANKALAQGGLFGAIGAAGIIASGLANVKSIVATEAPDTPSFASGGGAVPSVPSPPSFNIVGASQTSQLANAIGGKLNSPMKAYVVSKDISTAQELDRNKVQDASL